MGGRGWVCLERYIPLSARWVKERVRDWSMIKGMEMVLFFQLMAGFVASSQGCPKMVFSFPPLIM